MPPDESTQWAKLLGVDVDADAQTVCRAFEPLAKRLAPIELDGLPVYAVLTSTVRNNFPDLGGCFVRFAYFGIQDQLPEDRGAGVVLFVNDDSIHKRREEVARVAQQYYAAQGEQVAIEELLEIAQETISTIVSVSNTLTHELAHAIVHIATSDLREWIELIGGCPRTTGKMVKRYQKHISDWCQLEAGRTKQENHEAQKPNHGLHFVRVVAHLDARLRQRGVCGSNLVKSEQYGHAPFDECYASLSAELTRHRRSSFKEIISLPLPLAFEKCGLSTNGKAVA